MTNLVLRFGLSFSDLYCAEGLHQLDRQFLEHLAVADPALAARLGAARANPDALDRKDESALMVALAPAVEAFVGALFGIEAALEELRVQTFAQDTLHHCKRLFVQRRAAKAYTAEEVAGWDADALTAEATALIGGASDHIDELAFARTVSAWSADEAANAHALAVATRYAAWALYAPAGRQRHGRGLLFRVPHRLDPEHLVPCRTNDLENGLAALDFPPERHRDREGFALTDPGTDLAGALDQANYCIWCHHQGKDSCTRGLYDRKGGQVQKSPFGVPLTGCPLEVRISEMNEVKAKGHPLGALAVVTVDNPLCAGTGHRICNDCMKACVFQKQEPVDIPQIETRTLKDILALPWGFEVYGLLTRWNPLSVRRPVPRSPSGYKVLVVGLGPAGYALAHRLLNDGHHVVAVDGLKIEPLPVALSGVGIDGGRTPFAPIRDVATLWEALDDRVMAGFGGVAEYGITVRWDKNFLKVIRLLLERQAGFAMFGGVRLGGTLHLQDAFDLGFDHVALCVGAGRPTVIPMVNGLAPGVRQASDFLMTLQLTGAARTDSLANLEVRLPVVVIGGGLTAIDTATEALAYYPVQVEKFLSRYDTLVAERGAATVRGGWGADETAAADEFIAHGRALRAERAAAAAQGRPPAIRSMLLAWGGATLAYRRRLIDSPSYTLNHEEVVKAMEEGIRFIEQVTPIAVELDARGHAGALRVRHASGSEHHLPARTVLVAAGTQPNTVLAREFPGTLHLDGKYYQALDEQGRPVRPEASPKPARADVLIAIEPDGRAVSFFGDLHPSFAGNVVKAMAGARKGYPVVSRVLERRSPTPVEGTALVAKLNRELRATVHAVNRLAPSIIEIVVKAPQAAARFAPGQFFRLQNYETRAPRLPAQDGRPPTVLAMEGLALTGAWVDRARGLIATIVLEMGGSSSLCARLQPGEPIVLMGPTGAPTEIPKNETVCLIGGGLGNAVLFSIGRACRDAGSRVLYFAGYKKLTDRYKIEQIEAAADRIVWCCDEAPGFSATRPGDKSFVGNLVDAMVAYASGRLGEVDLPLRDADRLICIGSDRLMAAVARARHTVLAGQLKTDHLAIGSINSPMQCMMKEICAQCLQIHRDPATGEETVVFTCFNQDQELDRVDFGVLNQRLGQNVVQEKLTAQWIDRCLGTLG